MWLWLRIPQRPRTSVTILSNRANLRNKLKQIFWEPVKSIVQSVIGVLYYSVWCITWPRFTLTTFIVVSRHLNMSLNGIDTASTPQKVTKKIRRIWIWRRRLGVDRQQARCVKLTESITTIVLNYIRRGLFEQDKLTGATLLTFNILINDDKMKTSEVSYLLQHLLSLNGSPPGVVTGIHMAKAKGIGGRESTLPRSRGWFAEW